MSQLVRAAPAARLDRLTVAAGLAGLAAAVTLRVLVAGAAGAQSVAAGVVFGCAVLVLAVACGLSWPAVTVRALAVGIAGAGALTLPAWVRHLVGDSPAGTLGPPGPVWIGVVTLVAVAEELLLRGCLYQALSRWYGHSATVAVTAVAFAAIHVPVYGWTVVPVDLAVGIALGALRAIAGSVTAPVLAHTLADMAGWWLQ